MKATQNDPMRVGDVFAEWMSTADGCACGNHQPPSAALPHGDGFRCWYECADCGHAWTHDYPAGV